MTLETLTRRLVPLLDKLSPANRVRSEQGQLRFRFVAGVILLIFIYSAALAGISGLLPLAPDGHQVLVEFCLTTLIGCVVGLGILRVSGSTAACLHAFILTLLAALVTIALQLGGLFSPSMPVMLLIPALATSILGIRAGIFWTVVLVLILITFYQFDRHGIELPNVMLANNYSFGTVMGLGSAVVVTTLIILFYEFTTQKLNQRLKEAHDDYLFQANHDPLTGLSNRRHFIRLLDAEIAKANQEQRQFALLFFDLNHFKEANDSFGHNFGDEILQYVANRLRRHSRETDLIARWGGDEFAMLLPGLSSDSSVRLRIQSLVEEIGRPMTIGSETYTVGASIGYAIYPVHGINHEALMHYADHAMYAIKRENRTAISPKDAL